MHGCPASFAGVFAPYEKVTRQGEQEGGSILEGSGEQRKGCVLRLRGPAAPRAGMLLLMVEAMAVPRVSKHAPLFRLAKLILLLRTANESRARPSHPSGGTPGVPAGWPPPAQPP